MERTENIGFGGLKLIQDSRQFRYGVDAVILSDFASKLYPGFKNVVDLGTGNGIIPMILSHKNSSAVICGIDVQEDAISLAERSSLMNGLEDRVSFIHGDITDMASEDFRKKHGLCEGAYDMVTSNPPYFPKGGAIPSGSTAKFVARHETTASLEDFIKAASFLLKTGGHYFMVHRPSRLVDIFYHCRKYDMEPKDMRMVVPRHGEAPNIVLIHCVKGGGRELKVMKELAVYGEGGVYSEEIETIYERR